MNKLSARLELLSQASIIYSLVMYIVEIQVVGTDHSRQGPQFFLWSERSVAVLFTIEYAVRWYAAKDRRRYPFSALAIVDLLAILPFYAGFLVDMRMLRLIRTLRLLRLLKLYRYNAALQSLGASYRRVRYHLRIVGGIVFMFVAFSSTAIYECERLAQPAVFARYSDAVWWCVTTLTTVGYGDKFPVTAGGRFIATLTVIFGLGVFGTFISLIGGAFISTLNETAEQERTIKISAEIHDRLAALQGHPGSPAGTASVDALVERALEEFLAGRESRGGEGVFLTAGTRP